ncbi:MAG: DUF3168 domain-containing protein [Anaerococcus sp.]|nr:DUF3168 domain-containing protein [Anaerococcus sp.]
MNDEIYNLIFEKIQELGYDCYPFLPDDKASYPFVIVGETNLMPRATKSFSLGEVSVFVHVWTSKDNRSECQKIMKDIEINCASFASPHFWYLFSASSRILADNSTNDTLWHGVLDFNYKFY